MDTSVANNQAPSSPSPVDSAEGGTKSKVIFALSIFAFLAFTSGALYFFIFDKSSSLLGVANQARLCDSVGQSKVPIVPAIPTVQVHASATKYTTNASSKAPVIVLTTVVVLLLAGAAVGGYFLYQKMADEQHASMQQVGMLDDEIRKADEKLVELESGVKNGGQEQLAPIQRWIPDLISVVLSGAFFTTLYRHIKGIVEKRSGKPFTDEEFGRNPKVKLCICVLFFMLLGIGIVYGAVTGYYWGILWMLLWSFIAFIIFTVVLLAHGYVTSKPISESEQDEASL
jgi:hypothetical protein